MGRHNFKKLKIWETGMSVVDRVYDFTATLPSDERFNLISQCNRSAVSIPSNIAEGSGKSSYKDFARFIEIALGSAFELETQLLICLRRKIGDVQLLDDALAILEEEQRMLNSFHQTMISRV